MCSCVPLAPERALNRLPNCQHLIYCKLLRMLACPRSQRKGLVPAFTHSLFPASPVLLLRLTGIRHAPGSAIDPAPKARALNLGAAATAAAVAAAPVQDAPGTNNGSSPSAEGWGGMSPRILSSSFLSEDDGGAAEGQQQLAVVLLNWTLPELTPRLWGRGAC